MKGKKVKIFGVMMALAMVVSMASVGIASADPGSLKWTEIDIPEQGADGEYALWSGSGVGPIAVSPDGGTIFAASGEGLSQLMRSTDGGFTWKAVMTDLGEDDEIEDSDFGELIVDIVVSPDWDGDDTVAVATEDDVYLSENAGKKFASMDYNEGTITSLDLAADEDGNLDAFLVGSDDVYLKTGLLGGWNAQEVGDDYVALDAAFSPTYADNEQIVAIVTDGDSTLVRTKYGEESWDNNPVDVTLLDQNGDAFGSEYASMVFPVSAELYDASIPTILVGVGVDGDPIGDVYKIEGGTADDLDVRGMVGQSEPTETNIWSMAVSGEDILVGTSELNRDMTPNQYLVYVSADGGENWAASDKQPTGSEKATVVMGSAYVGTQGEQSAFSAATGDDMMSWNQRSLIDTTIDEITDVAPSPEYATDGTLYMATKANDDFVSLWQSTDQGDTWERVFSSAVREQGDEEITCDFDMVRLADNGNIVVAEKGNTEMYVSDDSAATWSRMGSREPINALTVVSLDVMYTGDTNGNVWQTTNGGDNWKDAEVADQVTSIAEGPEGALLAGTNEGEVYICYDKNDEFTFERVPGAAGNSNTYVAFDKDYGIDGNDTIYAASEGSGDIYRFVILDSTKWKTIYTGAVTGLLVAEDGTLYAPDDNMGVARSVNPASIEPVPVFEAMDQELDAGVTLEKLSVVSGGSSVLFAANNADDVVQLLTFADTLTGELNLLAPLNGEVTGDIPASSSTASVALVWESIDEAELYEFEVAIDPDFKTIILPGTTKGSIKPASLPSGKTYYWRARVIDPLFSQWSETRSFITPLGPRSAIPALESPSEGLQSVALRPVLEWSGIMDAVTYELEVRVCDSVTPTIEITSSETVYAVPSNLGYDTDYCWRVRAISPVTTSEWSDTGTFTTIAESEVDGDTTPTWVWVVIALSSILMVAVIVLIVRTRRAT